ncbi:MAG: LysM peptidoglycan-binding domain-containing protein [Treponema sp.]|jgi:nucleoid-associated protein YgaU|nr:LysM peptidoglycan-binding domain-containing protein [Treponema sp.]
MNRKTGLLLGGLLALGLPAFAQYELPEPVFREAPARTEVSPVPASTDLWFSDFNNVVSYLWDSDPAALPEPLVFLPSAVLAAAAASDAAPEVSQELRNNKYFLESTRLTNLAQESFDYGDYDASANYAAEAIRYAELSDEYVALQLKIKETNTAIASAKTRLDWAEANGALRRYPNEYGQAQGYYETSLTARSAEDWDGAIDAANQVITLLAYVDGEAPGTASPDAAALPAQYTVRPWNVTKDCLWNIAGRPWAYGDPTKWRLIYNANRSKLPQPDNPDLIHPGMVLDIPSLNGELRQGMWDSGSTYRPLP